MPNHSLSRSTVLGTRFMQPGEDPQPEQDDERPTVAGVGVDDPAFSHIVGSLRVMEMIGLDVTDPDVQKQAVISGRVRFEKEQNKPSPAPFIGPLYRRPESSPPPKSWVYYMRIGNRVKIGYSTNLRSRLDDIHPEELMAVEPGGPKVERQRHDQFRALRVHGEWFRLEEPLAGHIAELAVSSKAEIREVTRQAGRGASTGRPRVQVKLVDPSACAKGTGSGT